MEIVRPIGRLHVSRTARQLTAWPGVPVDLVLRRAALPEWRDDILYDAVDVW